MMFQKIRDQRLYHRRLTIVRCLWLHYLQATNSIESFDMVPSRRSRSKTELLIKVLIESYKVLSDMEKQSSVYKKALFVRGKSKFDRAETFAKKGQNSQNSTKCSALLTLSVRPSQISFIFERYFWLPVIFFEDLNQNAEKIALEKSFPTNPNMTYLVCISRSRENCI